MSLSKTMNRWLMGAALLALALSQPALAGAQTIAAPTIAIGEVPTGPGLWPTPPPGCPATTYTYPVTTPIPIPDRSTITSTIPVSGLAPYIWNVTARTSISHTFPSDLNVYLLAPNEFGFRNTLTTHNGDGNDNVFANTLWSDQAPYGVTEVGFAPNTNQPFLIPEGAMGAHFAHNPNGDWKLVVQDVVTGDVGILNNWTLSITTLPFRPIGASQFRTDNTSHAITSPGTLTRTLTVNNAGPVLNYVTLQAYIPYNISGDLRIRLTSPTGLTTTLVNNRGGALADLFNGVTFTDDPVGGGPVTDAKYQNGVALGQVQPEGAMRHFAGSNPNGTWTLTITSSGGSGSLNSWQLGIYTGHCDTLYLPAVRR
jgi:subtilisin-like proprotein convertase family protein